MPFGFIAPIAAILGAGSSIIGAARGSSGVSGAIAHNDALDQQAIAEGKTNLAYDRGNAQPYVDQGQNGLLAYTNLTGINGADAATAAMNNFTGSPGYGYQVSQGLKAVDNGAAAQGMLRSGATLRAEQTLGNNLANQDFNQYVARLGTVAGYGLQGAQLDNSSTSSYNNLLAGMTRDQTGTNASGAATNASIYGNMGNTIGNAVGTLADQAKRSGLFGTKPVASMFDGAGTEGSSANYGTPFG